MSLAHFIGLPPPKTPRVAGVYALRDRGKRKRRPKVALSCADACTGCLEAALWGARSPLAEALQHGAEHESRDPLEPVHVPSIRIPNAGRRALTEREVSRLMEAAALQRLMVPAQRKDGVDIVLVRTALEAEEREQICRDPIEPPPG